jgi:excisionase family DNA binding protein
VKEAEGFDEVLTVEETARFLKCQVKTVQYMVSTSQLPFFRLGKRLVRFRRSRLIEYAEEREKIEYRLPRGENGDVEGSAVSSSAGADTG